MRIQDNGIIAPRYRRGLLSMCVFSGFLRPSSTAWHSQFHASFVSIEWRRKGSPALLGLEAETKRDEEIVTNVIVGCFYQCFCTKRSYEVSWNSS